MCTGHRPQLHTLLTLVVVAFCAPAAAQVTLQPKMGEPVPGLTASELLRFDEGKIRFEQVFTAPEGLGPGFNDDSCASCHALPTTGGAGVLDVTRFGFADKGMPFDPLASQGGSLLQANAISDPCMEFVPANANVTTLRITPSTFGAGLVEAIPDADILALESPGGGMAHFVQPLEDLLGPLRVGRFGWKAQVATILTFSGDASLNEMGITNALVGTENAPNGDPVLLAACDTVSDPEDFADPQGFTFIERITDFQRFLAAPPQTPKSGMTGEQVFNTVGCANCHYSIFITGVAPETALTGKTIHPYSDFLLHSMGSLGDGIVQGAASELQIRTPALWGVRIRSPLIHDGRVTAIDLETTIDQAVGWHGGEAATIATAYAALSAVQHDQLIAFLDSLGKLEFDMNGDGIVDQNDIAGFVGCFTGPGAAITPDDPCAVADIDQDGDVDLDDFAFFEQAFEGPQEDCDSNGIWDVEALLDGTGVDTNGNGVLDACEVNFPRGDCNQDGGEDIGDAVFALDVLFGGTPGPSCLDACDNNDDGNMDIGDPIFLLNYLFGNGPDPFAPHPGCGVDPTPADVVDCVNHPTCP